MGCSVDEKGRAVLVMERMAADLELLIHPTNDLPEELRGNVTFPMKLNIALQVACAIDHMHEKDIVHRDLKPGNVLVDRTWKIKLTDFGCSCSVASTAVAPDPNPNIGTWQYIPPEILVGTAPVSKAYDIYSFALILWELFTEEWLWYPPKPKDPTKRRGRMLSQEELILKITCEDHRPEIPNIVPHKSCRPRDTAGIESPPLRLLGS
ncbi:Protein kinase domain [Pelomyxa schiedti]|nr:Protein kinase domain [Pelomyxa schiedti]